VVDAAGEVPAPLDAIAAIDQRGFAFRSQRPGDARVWRLAKELASDLCPQPTGEKAASIGDHRTPANGAIDLGQFFNDTECGQWR
jgi:hypothetical protein